MTGKQGSGVRFQQLVSLFVHIDDEIKSKIGIQLVLFH